jgi:hypothetical protein
MPSERVQMRYDSLTDHGRNKLGEAEAIKRAMAAANAPTTLPARSSRP